MANTTKQNHQEPTQESTQEPKKTKVLLAHQADDQETAEKLRAKIMIPAPDKLECVLLKENPQQGGWEKDLKTKIDETDLFLLWMPGNQVNKDDWDWFIWATAGVRWKINNGGDFPIVLLYNKSLVLPPPLNSPRIHTYENDIDELEQFLKYFYGSSEFTEDKQPLNYFFASQEKELYTRADDISKLFNEEEILKAEEVNFLIPRFINLRTASENDILPDKISDDLLVESNSETLRLFELRKKEKGWLWKDIVKLLPTNDSKWIDELAEAMHRAYLGKTVKPVQSTFRSVDGRIFKPILHKFTRFNNNSHLFEVFLVEQVSEPGTYNAPNIQLEILLPALNISTRIQWEVCEYHLQRLEREGEFQENLKRIQESYNNIEKDAEISGVRNREDRVRDSFDSDEDKQEVTNNIFEQSNYKKVLTDANQETDISTIRDALTNLTKLNSQLMIKLTQRYSELITKKYAQDIVD